MRKLYVLCLSLLVTPFLLGCGQVWSTLGQGQGSGGTSNYIFPNKIWALGGSSDTTGLNYNTVYVSGDGGLTWTTPNGAVLPAVTSSGTPLVFGNYLYYLGGTNPAGNADTNFVWRTQDGVNWDTTRTLPAIRADAVTLNFLGCLWQVSGTNTDENSAAIASVIESCDGGTTWAAMANFPVPVFTAAGVVYNNKMWVIGGCTNGPWTCYNNVYSSPDGLTWTLAGHYPLSLNEAKATVFNNAIYVAGGDAGPVTAAVYSSTDGSTWNFVGNMPAARANGGLVVYNNKLIYVGGDSTSWETGTVSTVYSSATGGTGTWTTSSLPIPLGFFDQVVVY